MFDQDLPMEMSADEIYRYVNALVAVAKVRGQFQLANQLETAMQLGSSGLEILGAIGNILRDNAALVDSLLPKLERLRVQRSIAYYYRR
ncbi:hypothetical protein Psta_2315 [Pirellula staleyi DSM 6068]|uniref:Uncharacterized protein n=1 Tax=Pirellula staleyi (strain ATCC 27377 / DSM 6068 / ICPB 4128) TaxID=530564 RepID=D2R3N1_PIRSD|nr:hypothetical protein [Pirellula staleyi]ADB16985.1 hypothetical protein Psta_2315 [Pirellula staleyi DSM 6068]